MITDDIREYHAALAESDQAICDTLAAVIDKNLKDAECKIWHAHPVWFLAGNPIVGYSKLKDSVRLLFWSGQSFGEPDLHPEDKFKAAEARYTDAKQIDKKLLKRWLTKAHDIQWDYQNLVKRKGRLEKKTEFSE